MTTTSPSLSPVPSAPRRRRWPWVVGFCLAPFAVLALVAMSTLSLDRDAAALRRHVIEATDSHWRTKVQVSVGGLTLGAVRAGLAFVRHKDIEKARLGLQAVSHASVGVYQRESVEGVFALGKLLAETDRAMHQRGWSRLLAVGGKRETVLAYVPRQAGEGEVLKVCLAVLKDRELVVVSVDLKADPLAELAELQLSEELSGKFRRHLRPARPGGVAPVPASE